MKTVFMILSILLQSGPVWAEKSKDEICRDKTPPGLVEKYSMPQGKYAAWWTEYVQIKVGETKKTYGSVMCSRNHQKVNEGNCLIDLDRGTIQRAPGMFDGQWTRDQSSEPLYTVPNKWNIIKGDIEPGLTFFRHSDVLEKKTKAKVLFHDPTFGNHYHSFGVAGRGDGYVIHRAMNDKWGVSIRDYRADLDANGKVTRITPVGPERNLTNGPEDTEKVKSPTTHAESQPHHSYFDLPMIAPDQNLFAANNRKTMTTQIFEITENGKRLVADLGLEAGKVSFAPQQKDGKVRIAFHVDNIDPAEGDKMTSTHGGMTKDVMIVEFDKKNEGDSWKLEASSMIRVTSDNVLGEGNYYPKWINSDEIVFVHSKPGSKRHQQSFIKANLSELAAERKKMQALSLATCSECMGQQPQFEAVVAMGSLVADLCTSFADKLTARESALYSLQLDRESCQKLASSWDDKKARLKTLNSLFELRQPKKPGTQRVGGYNFHESASKRGEERVEKAADRGKFDNLSSADLLRVCDSL